MKYNWNSINNNEVQVFRGLAYSQVLGSETTQKKFKVI